LLRGGFCLPGFGARSSRSLRDGVRFRVARTRWRARFSLWSPLRSRRWRIVWPDEAGIGATPARRANAASLGSEQYAKGCSFAKGKVLRARAIDFAAAQNPQPRSGCSAGAAGAAAARALHSFPSLELVRSTSLPRSSSCARSRAGSRQADVIVAWSHTGRVRSEAAFARLAGAAPVRASSGQTSVTD
jgi:hypothetical protein